VTDDPKTPLANGEDSEARLRRLRENFARASGDLDRSAKGKTPPAGRKPAIRPAGAPLPPKTRWKLDWWGVTLAVLAVLVVVFAVRSWVT
jgi:hypothetical protein